MGYAATNTFEFYNTIFTEDLMDNSKTYTTTLTLMYPDGNEVVPGGTTDDTKITWKLVDPDCINGKDFVTPAAAKTIYYGINNADQKLDYAWTFSTAKCAVNVEYALAWTTSLAAEYTIPSPLKNFITIKKKASAITAGSVLVTMKGADGVTI